MGGHRKSTRPKPARSAAGAKSARTSPSFPPLPDNVGRRTKWTSIRGEPRPCTIIDEIRRVQSNAPFKVIVLQKIIFEVSGETEYRLGYYMIGVKPRMAGRWTWGQFAILIPANDFRWIIAQAQEKGWL